MQITIHSKGTQQGPFPADHVKQLLQSGQVSPSDLGWSPGMAEWKPLSSFAELSIATAPPPVPNPEYRSGGSGKTVTEPLAIWSLVLGIISIVGCAFGGVLAGIPAVICGHIGRSRIQGNPSLRGAGMALAGLICGYLSVAVVPVAIIAAIAIPNIAGITQQANEAKAMRNAQNFASVGNAARAVGYTGSWTTTEEAVADLISGITVGPSLFQVTGISPEDARKASEHLKVEDGNLIYTP